MKQARRASASAAICLRRESSERSASSVPESAAAQSIGLPSRMSRASAARASSSVTLHLLREPEDRALRRFPRRVGRGLSERKRQFVVAEPHLETTDDGFALFRFQASERPLVRLHRLLADGLLERGPPPIELDTLDVDLVGAAELPADLVPEPVQYGLSQIGLERTGMARFEDVHSLERLEQGVLDEVVGVGEVPRPPRQAAAGEALEGLQVPGEQAFDGLLVATAGALDQLERRLDAWIPVRKSGAMAAVSGHTVTAFRILVRFAPRRRY